MSKPLTAQLWDLMDDATERFMGIPKEQRDTPEALKAAGEARGLANALTVMCSPYLDEKNAAAKLAIARMKARQAGEGMPATPGYMSGEEARALNRRRHAEQREASKAEGKKVMAERGEKVLPETSGELSEDDKVALANLGETKLSQIQNGIRLEFGNEKLADLYEVSLAVIMAIEGEMQA